MYVFSGLTILVLDSPLMCCFLRKTISPHSLHAFVTCNSLCLWWGLLSFPMCTLPCYCYYLWSAHIWAVRLQRFDGCSFWHSWEKWSHRKPLGFLALLPLPWPSPSLWNGHCIVDVSLWLGFTILGFDVFL